MQKIHDRHFEKDFFSFQGDGTKKVTQRVCISDHMLVKPKCVWEAYIYFENYKQTAENENKCQMHFDFTNMGQKCIFSEL